MDNQNFTSRGTRFDSTSAVLADDISVEPLTKPDHARVVSLIRRNLQDFEEFGSVLASTFRRLENLSAVYDDVGPIYFVAKNMHNGGECIGGAGLGPLHGLPTSEGVAEIRDLVVDKSYREKGIGARLIKRCIAEARKNGYSRLYLETTPKMQNAQKLFLRFGFRPVTDSSVEKNRKSIPCYFVLENLNDETSE